MPRKRKIKYLESPKTFKKDRPKSTDKGEPWNPTSPDRVGVSSLFDACVCERIKFTSESVCRICRMEQINEARARRTEGDVGQV
jgi:hypothetical protein